FLDTLRQRIRPSLSILAELHLKFLDPAIDQGVNVADVFFHLLDKLKRLIAFGPHFGDVPIGLPPSILKLSDAIRLWFLLWNVISFLPGEASGPASSIRGEKIWRSPSKQNPARLWGGARGGPAGPPGRPL